jgi:hypothetical protein
VNDPVIIQTKQLSEQIARVHRQETFIQAAAYAEAMKARQAAEQNRMLALIMFAQQYHDWLKAGSVGAPPLPPGSGGAGLPPALPPSGGSVPPGRPRLTVIDHELGVAFFGVNLFGFVSTRRSAPGIDLYPE